MKISICIPTFNRNNLLFESFAKVIDDDRVGEVIIVDDASKEDVFEAVKSRCINYPKVRLFRQPKNVGVYENKAAAVSKASNEYCIIFDSDNVLDIDYLDKIYSVKWSAHTILAPDFAKPVFDYRKFGGITMNKINVAQYSFEPGFDCLANTHNFFVNKDAYLSAWEQHTNILGADSIYFLYLWLLAGNDFHVLKGLEYFHRVGDKTEQKSNYVTFAEKSAPICEKIRKQISLMR